MRYIITDQVFTPKHCIYGPRPVEGIVLNNVEWWSIADHLVKEEREREFIAIQRQKEQAKKEFSYNMTKTWENTLASIKILGEQRRLEKMEREKQDKIDKYNEILETRKKEKKELLEKVKEIMLENADAVKTLNSAVLLSTVIDERKKQIEFKKSLEEVEAVKNREMAEKFKKDAEDFEREKIEEKIKETAKKRIQKMALDKQMEEIKKKKQMEAEELEAEKEDLKNMRIEAKKIENCELIEAKYQKEFAKKYLKKTENQVNFERMLVLEQEEEDAINKLYLDYDRRFKKERKEREEKMKKDVIEKRRKMAEELAEKLRNLNQKEQELLDNSLREKEEAERIEEERKAEMRRQALANLLEGKRKAEEDQARRQHELEEEKKWQMMQVYRSAEIDAEWREEQRRRKKERQAQTRADYDKQCAEMKEEQERELKEWLKPLVDPTKEKENINKFCQSALDFVRDNKMPEYPVLVAIQKVKKEYGVTDEEKEKGEDDKGEKKKQPKTVTGFCYCFRN